MEQINPQDESIQSEPAAEAGDIMPSTEELLQASERKAQEHYDAWMYAKAETENMRRRAADLEAALAEASDTVGSAALGGVEPLRALAAIRARVGGTGVTAALAAASAAQVSADAAAEVAELRGRLADAEAGFEAERGRADALAAQVGRGMGRLTRAVSGTTPASPLPSTDAPGAPAAAGLTSAAVAVAADTL